MKKRLFIILMTTGLSGYAQVGIGTSSPHASAQLEVSAPNKGILIPRVVLTATTVAAPVVTPEESLLVYNTNTAGDVSPGFYYWNKSSNKWATLSSGGIVPSGDVANVAATIVAAAATTTYEVPENVDTILCDASSGILTVKLPNVATNKGKVLIIRKTDTTNNAVIFSPALKFSKDKTVEKLNYIQSIRIKSDGTDWNIIN